MTPTNTPKTSSTKVTAKHVLATLNYYLEPEKGGSDKYILGSGNDLELNQYDSAEVTIQNIRGKEPDFRLDEHGFELLQNVDTIQSSDLTYLEEEYYGTIVRTLMARTGASEVIVTSNIRRMRKANPNPRRNRSIPISYASLVHVDQSYSGARVKFSNKYPHFSGRFDHERWAVINWWQPFGNPATRMPLAVCDGNSIADEDWREITATSSKGRYTRSPQEEEDSTLHIDTPPMEMPGGAVLESPLSHDAGLTTPKKRYNPDHGMWRVVKPKCRDEHKWYFVQDMQPHEALVIKIFDSQTQGVSRRTPHSAFESPLDYGPERTSIEFRCLAFWDGDGPR